MKGLQVEDPNVGFPGLPSLPDLQFGRRTDIQINPDGLLLPITAIRTKRNLF